MLVNSEPYELLILGCSCNPSVLMCQDMNPIWISMRVALCNRFRAIHNTTTSFLRTACGYCGLQDSQAAEKQFCLLTLLFAFRKCYRHHHNLPILFATEGLEANETLSIFFEVSSIKL
jgi:hypothetical protein